MNLNSVLENGILSIEDMMGEYEGIWVMLTSDFDEASGFALAHPYAPDAGVVEVHIPDEFIKKYIPPSRNKYESTASWYLVPRRILPRYIIASWRVKR